MNSLDGKVAIVTGSGNGLGRAYARELARRGCAVVVNDIDPATAASAVAEIEESGGRATSVVAPVGTSEVADALVAEAVRAFGRLDILVTNAGILRDKSLLKMTDDDFDSVVNVHLRGTFTCVRSAYAHFKAHDVAGRIITIGSPTGQRGTFGQTNYAAAKAGIVGMVRTWAIEMARSQVTVNTVVPVAMTEMTHGLPYFDAAVQAGRQGVAIPEFFRREVGFGLAEDVAGVIAFLASDAAADITGQVIGVGGDRIQIWSHPEPVVSAYEAGGWRFDAATERLPSLIDDHRQTVGERFPDLPPDLTSVAAAP